MQDEGWRHESGDADGHAAVHPEDQATQGLDFVILCGEGYRNFICLFCNLFYMRRKKYKKWFHD